MTRIEACDAMCVRAGMVGLFTVDGLSDTAQSFVENPGKIGGCQAVIFGMALGLLRTGALPEPDASIYVPEHKTELLRSLVQGAQQDAASVST